MKYLVDSITTCIEHTLQDALLLAPHTATHDATHPMHRVMQHTLQRMMQHTPQHTLQHTPTLVRVFALCHA